MRLTNGRFSQGAMRAFGITQSWAIRLVRRDTRRVANGEFKEAEHACSAQGLFGAA
jgi:hypothetical protein